MYIYISIYIYIYICYIFGIFCYTEGLCISDRPVSCQVEAPEGCGFHVMQFSTAGVDLEATNSKQ